MAGGTVLVEVERGGVVESVHRGAIAVVEGDRTTFTRGDVRAPVFYRSTMKPLQALPLVTSGAADAFGLEPAELALACGSHSGAAEHVATARSILRKAGLDESLLRCGGHWSSDVEVARWQRTLGEKPASILSNCSGKHSGMLAAAKHRGEPLETYVDPEHPLQREIRTRVATCTGLRPEELTVAVDGCSAPTIAVPLEAMARSFGRIADPSPLPAPVAAAARRLATAMRTQPAMVAGRWRFDTDLMLAGKGKLVAKAGAEGVHAVMLPEMRRAMAIKVEDGDDRGYRIVVVEMLRRWGVLSEPDAAALLEKHASPVVRNWAGVPVGKMRAVIDD